MSENEKINREEINNFIEKNWDKIEQFLNLYMKDVIKSKQKQRIAKMVIREIYKLIIQPISEENMEVTKNFLDSAKENLDAYEFHYERKNFSQCIFNLTLASEKLVKSYGLFFGGIKKDELRKIGHNQTLNLSNYVRKRTIQILFLSCW
ncbi:MAG: hypothetical protein QXF32_02615 [Candidatus Thermoplasmatota archaeon]